MVLHVRRRLIRIAQHEPVAPDDRDARLRILTESFAKSINLRGVRVRVEQRRDQFGDQAAVACQPLAQVLQVQIFGQVEQQRGKQQQGRRDEDHVRAGQARAQRVKHQSRSSR